VPNRKASIYTEGALITFILDVEIRKATKGEKSFDDVMRSLNDNYYKKGKGVSEKNYQDEVEKLVGRSMSEFFNDFVNGTDDISQRLEDCMDYFGMQFKKLPTDEYYEAYLGIRLVENKVISVYPNSVAERAGISLKDEILSINNVKINNDLSDWCKYFKDDEVQLQILDGNGFVKEVEIESSSDSYYGKYELSFEKELNANQKKALKNWRGW
jgi:predicted metalloprotease with PDZ domain